MSTTPITHNCAKCNLPLDPIADLPELKNYLVTSCFHIFHTTCLSPWVDESEKPCPLCKRQIYQMRAGKYFLTIWLIFLQVLHLDTDLTFKTLSETAQQNGFCPSCQDYFPKLPIVFDPQKQQLLHEKCAYSSQLQSLLIEDVVRVILQHTKKDPGLKALLKPTRPSPWERLQHYHPFVAKFLPLGVISLCVFLIKQQN